MSKTHASLRPVNNILFMILEAVAAALFLFVLEPRVPITLAVFGGGLGAVAGLMQHMSFAQARDRFAVASSLLDVRRALKETSWGSRYILWLYSCKAALIVSAAVIIRRPLLQIIFGYLTAYASLMFVREVVTLKDTLALSRLDFTPNASPDAPQSSH
jgi:hypothetical protein